MESKLFIHNMPGTIELKSGKRLLEIRTFQNSKEVRQTFEELNRLIIEKYADLNAASTKLANGLGYDGPVLHFLISTYE